MSIYPFEQINGRNFFACVGVVVNKTGGVSGRWGRTELNGTEDIADGVFLRGVQSVGINSEFPAASLMDVGRFQRQYTFYAPQTFEITIERVIGQTDNFFYHVDTSDYVASESGYQSCHILKSNNIGFQGSDDTHDRCLRNYDVTILYGPDHFDRLGSENHRSVPPPPPLHADKDAIYTVTYRNCLLSSMSYSFDVTGAVKESITLIGRRAEYNLKSSISDFTNDMPSAAAQSDNVISRIDLDMLGQFQTTETILPEEVEKLFEARNSDDEVAYGDFEGSSNPHKRKILGIQSISIEATIEYTSLTDVGIWRGSDTPGEENLWRQIVLPVQVTASFTGVTRQPLARRNSPSTYLPVTDTTFTEAQGDTSSKQWMYQAPEESTIRIVAQKFPPTRNYFVWDLGGRNYLTNISYDGGGTDGGNVEATMSYQNDYSDFVLVKDTSVKTLPSPTKPF